MNEANGLEAASIRTIAATIAATITQISSTIPTAVMTLSSEKTTSNNTI